MKLIDKAALVAEIEKRIEETKSMQPKFDQFWAGQISAFKGVLKIIDTLEVKEVDLEKEIETHLKDCLDVKFPTTDIELIKKDVAYTAKKFFELGMSVSKQAEKDLELTCEDIRELYIVFAEVDTEIELCKTDIKTETLGYYQEVLKRFKAKRK